MALNFANNNSLSAISAKPSGLSGGAMNLISTQTASGSANLSFTSGIDDTYDSYVFKFYNIHPATDNVQFLFNMSSDSGSNYNVTKTTTYFLAEHNATGGSANLSYQSAKDLAQSTDFQKLMTDLGNAADENLSGYLTIYNPSSTTFVKNFMSRTNAQAYSATNISFDNYIAGYGNTTSAVNAVQFKMSSGTFDGVIKLYGVS
mgnify:FL=1